MKSKQHTLEKELQKAVYKVGNLEELIKIYLESNFLHKKPLTKYQAEIHLRDLIEISTNSIDLNAINDYISKNTKWNQNTKRSKLANISTFLKWLSAVKGFYINTKKLIKYSAQPSKKQEYSITELAILRDTILNIMKNQKFYCYFEILLWNGIRVGELELINWNKLRKEDNSVVIQALKNGNERAVEMPPHIGELAENIDFNWRRQTILNLFTKLKNIVKKKYPDWYKPISSHCGRVHRTTQAYLNGMSSTEISVMLGAKNFHTFQGTYIRGSKTIKKNLVQKANQNPINSMNDYEKDLEIQKLRKINELFKVEIQQLKEKISFLKTNNIKERTTPKWLTMSYCLVILRTLYLNQIQCFLD